MVEGLELAALGKGLVNTFESRPPLLSKKLPLAVLIYRRARASWRSPPRGLDPATGPRRLQMNDEEALLRRSPR